MFEKLLTGIFDRNGLHSRESQAEYLSKLRDTAKTMWLSYRPNNKGQKVDIKYSKTEAQDVYLLRYFPSYTLPLKQELDALRADGITLPAPKDELLQACFLGCGPGPEIIGLIEHLKTSEPIAPMLLAKMVDIAETTWSHARDIAWYYLAEPLWEERGLIDHKSLAASLSDGDKLNRIGLECCHLAVVQNCLNEIPVDEQPKVVTNILQVFRQLSPGAIALVIDRQGYPETTTKMMKDIQKAAVDIDNLTPIGGSGEIKKTANCKPLLSNVPAIINDNLLHVWGSRLPSWAKDIEEVKKQHVIYSHSVDYICAAFKVGPTPAKKKDGS